jgi:F-type H+-transporting ATPase subunit gamma
MASLRDIRKRIRSIKNTRQITKAMKMVSAARLRRAQEALLATRPYAEALDQMMAELVPAGEEGAQLHPLFATRPVKKVHLVLFTSDRGLAGGFNANAIRTVSRFLEEESAAYESVKLSTVGRKGFDYFRRRSVKLGKDHPSLYGKLNYATASEFAAELVTEFASGETDAVYLVYNEFISAISQSPTRKQLLPFVRPEAKATTGPQQDFEFEPSRGQVLERLVPQSLAVKVFRALLESVAAEHGARMNAMDNATNNARDIITALTLTYNRTRQAAITKELVEIVSGAEALK